MTPQQIKQFLLHNIPKLEGKLDWIEQQDIDGFAFERLTDENLKELGIPLGLRLEILSFQSPKLTLQQSQLNSNPTKVRTIYSYFACQPDELSFKANETIIVLQQSEQKNWWQGELNGKIGFFPKNYVSFIHE